MLTPVLLIALFLVFIICTWVLALAESAFTYPVSYTHLRAHET